MPTSPFKEKALQYLHINPQVGHTGFLKTYQRAKENFYWERMKKDVKKIVKKCAIYQENKTKSTHPLGLLQPLSIP